MDVDEYGNLPVSKRNRRKKLELKTHTTELNPPPILGTHELNRKEKERLEKKKLEELLKK